MANEPARRPTTAVQIIIRKAASMGVRLSISGETVTIRGPADATAAIKALVARHKAEVFAYLVMMAPAYPAEEDVAFSAPWGERFSNADADKLRTDLVALIESLAEMENWDRGRKDDVLTRAVRSPLSDLLPNLAHYREAVDAAQAEIEARRVVTWRGGRFNERADGG